MKLFAPLVAMLFAMTAAAAEAETALTVSAAASLKDALGEIKALHAEAHPGVAMTLNFGGSGALATQIEHGAPVDVFISAAPKQMDTLEQRELLAPGTRRNLLTNSLVLIAPRDSAAVQGWEDLAKPEVKRIAVGEPKSVPVGMYAAEVFTKLKLAERLEGKLVRMLDVRQVLTTVSTGNADAGVVYASDLVPREAVRRVADAPAGSHSPITYPIAVVKSTKAPREATAFATFLASEQARAVFRRFGFGIAL